MPLCVRQNQTGVQPPSEFHKLCAPEPLCFHGNHMRAATGVPETTSGQLLCAPERTSGHLPARLPTATRTRNYAPAPSCAPEMTSRRYSVRTRRYLPSTTPRCSRNCLQTFPCEDQKLLPCRALCAPENVRHNSMAPCVRPGSRMVHRAAVCSRYCLCAPPLYSPEPHPSSLLCTPKLHPGSPCVLQKLVCPAGCTPVRRSCPPEDRVCAGTLLGPLVHCQKALLSAKPSGQSVKFHGSYCGAGWGGVGGWCYTVCLLLISFGGV